MDSIGEKGRSMHAFGPEVSVDDDASDLAKVLGRSGRDPEWSRG